MDVKVSKDKHISRWVDREKLIYIRLNNQKPCIKTKNDWSKTLIEVKPVQNIRKNLQSFLEKSAGQKEVIPLYKLQDHAYE